MIEESYVSFETAQLLRDKGFDVGCHSFYDYAQRLQFTESVIYDSELSEEDNECVAPTLQMSMKWLRIEHNIHIEPHIVRTKYSYGYLPNYIDLKELKQHFPFDEFDFSDADKYVCITYDKACEETIKYCLENLI